MNSLPRYALSVCAALAALAGCGPDDGSKELEQGRDAYERQHDLKKAERLFEKSVELNATNVEAFVYLTRLNIDLGNMQAANGWIAKAAEMSGGSLDVKLLRAQLAWHGKDYDTAAKLFSDVAEDKSLGAAERAQGWTGLGIVEMTRDKRHQARIAFMRAIRLDRHAAAPRYHLGVLYMDNFGYSEAALEQFEAFVRLDDPSGPRVQKVLRTKIPELKDAIVRQAAERPGVQKRDSAASAAALAKGDAAAKKGAYKTARQHYQAAVQSDPLNYPAAIGLAKAWLKSDSTAEGQKKALESYRNACTLKPGAMNTFIEAGTLALKLGMYAQAVEIYSRAVATAPYKIEAIDGLIRAMRRAGGANAEAQAYQGYRDFLVPPRKK